MRRACVQESVTALIKYFVDAHHASVENVTYVETFHKLKQRRCQLQRQQDQRLHDSNHRYTTLWTHDTVCRMIDTRPYFIRGYTTLCCHRYTTLPGPIMNTVHCVLFTAWHIQYSGLKDTNLIMTWVDTYSGLKDTNFIMTWLDTYSLGSERHKLDKD